MKKRISPNGKKQTRVFNVRLEVEMMDELRALAGRDRRTMTNLVQLMIAEGIVRRQVGLEA